MSLESSKQERRETAVVTGQSDAVSCAEDSAAIDALARRFRHIGYTVFGLLALFTAAFLLFQVITALVAGDVSDPFTGAPVVSEPQSYTDKGRCRVIYRRRRVGVSSIDESISIDKGVALW